MDFAKDIANGIFTLVEQNEVSEAVIGSGKGYSIHRSWLRSCFNVIGKDGKNLFVNNQDLYLNIRFWSLILQPSIDWAGILKHPSKSWQN